ncbi:hypothetical protein VNO80_01834 [Phaseolus coccineus]|uniref:Uncharacterized protein n=1 Tax=Phaseolus coccineus TaxID=3886 RepID=A0AAN9RT80_PHACN
MLHFIYVVLRISETDQISSSNFNLCTRTYSDPLMYAPFYLSTIFSSFLDLSLFLISHCFLGTTLYD